MIQILNFSFIIFTAIVTRLSYASIDVKVIGKLAQTIKFLPIRLRPHQDSKVLYKTKKYEYIIVKKCSHLGWLEVIMQTGITGFILRSGVAELPYEVTQKKVYHHNSSKSWAMNQSLRFIGTPYKFGGEDFKKGIDCSAFVQKIYGSIGLSLPRTAAQQALIGTPVERLEKLQSGDRLYFWENKRNKIGHTGLYLGNGFFIHSSSKRKGIFTDNLKNSKWLKILVAARR